MTPTPPTPSPIKITAETPRTDAEPSIRIAGETRYVPADFARTLERELNAAKAEKQDAEKWSQTYIEEARTLRAALVEGARWKENRLDWEKTLTEVYDALRADVARVTAERDEARTALNFNTRTLADFGRTVSSLRVENERLREALEIARVGMCAVAVPHPKEREVLQDAMSAVTAALSTRPTDGPGDSEPRIGGHHLCNKGHGWVVNGQPCYLCTNERMEAHVTEKTRFLNERGDLRRKLEAAVAVLREAKELVSASDDFSADDLIERLENGIAAAMQAQEGATQADHPIGNLHMSAGHLSNGPVSRQEGAPDTKQQKQNVIHTPMGPGVKGSFKMPAGVNPASSIHEAQ